jgi:cytochrome b561
MADTADRPAVYSSNQMLAHWVVVSLVLFQFAQGWTMERAFWAGAANGGAIVHGITGTFILGFMLWRVVLRRRHGAPPPPKTEPSWLQKISRGTHFAFYGLLIGMPLFGIAAVLTGIGILATVHGIAAWVLLALAALHLSGALWHAFKGDGVVRRMLRDEPTRLPSGSGTRTPPADV